MKNQLIRLLTALTAGLFLAACQLPLPSPGAGSGTVRLTLNSGRTVVAGLNSVDHYDISLTQQGFNSLVQTLKPDGTGTTVTIPQVPLGTWTVAVTGRTAAPDNLPVATGNGTLTLSTAGQTVSQAISVTLAQTAGGSGNFRLPVQFNTATGIDFVQASLRSTSSATWTDLGSVTVTTASGVSSATVTSATALTSGTYQLLVTFRRGGATGTSAGVLCEAVNIWDNVVSDRWVDPADGSLKSSRTFTDNEFFSTNTRLAGLSLQAGSTLTLSPGFTSGTTAYSVTTTATSVTLTGTGSLDGQTMEIQVGTGAWTPLHSGTASGEITLAAGPNTVNLRVTAPDHSRKDTYTVTVYGPVTLAPADVPVNAGSMTPSTATAVAFGTPVSLNATLSGTLTTAGYTFAGWVATPAAAATFADASLATTTVTLTESATIKPTFAKTYASQGLSLLSLNFAATVTAKAWGAGGGGSTYYYYNGNYTNAASGGAGGYASSSFGAVSGDEINVVVGAGGGRTVGNTALPVLGGLKGTGATGDGGAGGGGSVVLLKSGTTFTVKAVAGGGGGAAGVEYEGCDAMATQSGTPMALTGTALNTLGGNGASAAYKGDGAGGGGYVGGSAPGNSGTWYPGTGGSCYATGTGAVTAGSTGGHVVPNKTDPQYPANAAVPGLGSTAGYDGAVVITLSF